MRMILISVCLGALLVGGCGGGSGDDGVQVIATTTIVADIARHVAGDEVDVESLLPESASPHDYALSAKERARLDDADLVVAWGAGLEAGLELGDDALELAGDERDPHVWMDPGLVADALPALADALAEADPDHANAYRRRGSAYARDLDRFGRELDNKLAVIPLERRKLVSSHDSLGHFVDRFDFEFVGAPFGL